MRVDGRIEIDWDDVTKVFDVLASIGLDAVDGDTAIQC